MFERLDECPCCRNTSFDNFIICKDYTVSKESFAIAKCNHCGCLFTNPRPTEQSISKYYQSEEYISHSNKTKSIFDFAYKLVRNYSLRKKVKLINDLSSNKRLLDYGCGTGHFLQTAHNSNWEVTGVEPSNIAQANLNKSVSKNVFDSLDNIPKDSSFDVITLWHVLEHIHDLDDTINSLRGRLHKKGKMVFAVPNHNSYDAKHFKEHWAAYDVPRHLYHFSKNSMKILLSRHKLTIEKILPMKFDSYYVSLLSNQYKFGYKKVINSIITGYNSNSYADKSGEYSSLIYIVSKQ